MRRLHQTGIDIRVIKGETTVIVVSGEIDVSNVDSLRTAIEGAILESSPGLIIDLRPTDYLDSCAIAAIMAARHTLVDLGGALVLVATNPNIKRSLSLLHLDMIPGISMCEDTAAATELLRARRGE